MLKLMNRFNKNENGFAGVEFFLIIVAVILLGVMGWLIYKREHKATTTTTTQSRSSTLTVPAPKAPSSATTPSVTNNIKIASLGIQFTAPDSIKDLTFSAVATEGKENRVAVSTEALATMDSACSVSKSGVTGLSGGPLGTIVYGTGTSPYPEAGDPNLFIKQFSGYYVAYEPPQMGYCSANTDASNASKADISALQVALKSVEQI
jgi:hypothetical protein